MVAVYIKVSGLSVPQLSKIVDSYSIKSFQELARDQVVVADKSGYDFDFIKKAFLWWLGSNPEKLGKPPPVVVEEIDEKAFDELSAVATISHKKE